MPKSTKEPKSPITPPYASTPVQFQRISDRIYTLTPLLQPPEYTVGELPPEYQHPIDESPPAYAPNRRDLTTPEFITTHPAFRRRRTVVTEPEFIHTLVQAANANIINDDEARQLTAWVNSENNSETVRNTRRRQLVNSLLGPRTPWILLQIRGQTRQ